MSDYYEAMRQDRARFLEHTSEHRMTIMQDDGVFRHIHVGKPDTSNMHFNITTVPGYLMFTGDMGSYVFSRTRDMFEFHRLNWDQGTPIIDYRYWSEKAQAVDKYSGLTEFDERAFRKDALREFWNHKWPDIQTKRFAWAHGVRDVVSGGFDSSTEATQAMLDVTYVNDYETVHPFAEFYEYGPFEKPSFRLRWACWAIAHTIRDYDLGGDRHTRQAAHDARVLNCKE